MARYERGFCFNKFFYSKKYLFQSNINGVNKLILRWMGLFGIKELQFTILIKSLHQVFSHSYIICCENFLDTVIVIYYRFRSAILLSRNDLFTRNLRCPSRKRFLQIHYKIRVGTYRPCLLTETKSYVQLQAPMIG